MKQLISILTILFLFGCKTKSQEVQSVSVIWGNTSENNEEVKKTKQFLNEQKIEYYKIYHARATSYMTLDTIPYTLFETNDTLFYSLSVVMAPRNIEEFMELMKNKNSRSYYIDGIESDGRISVHFLEDYTFFRKEGSVYYISSENKYVGKELSELYKKYDDAKTNNDTTLINSIEKNLFEKYSILDLVFNIDRLSKRGNTLKTNERKMELANIFLVDKIKCFHLTSTAMRNEETDLFFDYIIDENLKFIKIGYFTFKKYE